MLAWRTGHLEAPPFARTYVRPLGVGEQVDGTA
jgi:hypothetical protein